MSAARSCPVPSATNPTIQAPMGRSVTAGWRGWPSTLVPWSAFFSILPLGPSASYALPTAPCTASATPSIQPCERMNRSMAD